VPADPIAGWRECACAPLVPDAVNGPVRAGQFGGAARPGGSGLTQASRGEPIGLVPAVEQVWAWLAADDHQPLLRLWAEAYARSLVEPDGAWAGFARATVEDWLGVLASCQPSSERDSEHGAPRRTIALTVLRGALLDLLATGDYGRITAAVDHQLDLLRHPVQDRQLVDAGPGQQRPHQLPMRSCRRASGRKGSRHGGRADRWCG
jgi:hypothetical protein